MDKRYSVLSILKYNIIGKENDSDEEEETSDSDNDSASNDSASNDSASDDSASNDSTSDIDDANTITSCISEYDIDFNSSYLTVIKNIEDIHLENTLPSFQDLNEILILFYILFSFFFFICYFSF